jgi:hypothetical protein
MRPASLPPARTILDMDPTPGRIVRTFAKGNTTVKTPNLVQRPTGPTIYPAMKLPPMVNVPKTNDPALPSRIQQPAPQPKPVK